MGRGKGTPNKHLRDRAARFWEKVQRGDGCWEWQAYRTPLGYGRFSIGNRMGPAHRAVWELTNGPIPTGLWVMHRCDNPPCVRPDHLMLGTRRDNIADMDQKGRRGAVSGDQHPRRRNPDCWPRGERHHKAKLSDAEVVEIRRRIATGERHRLIAADYPVGRSQIANIASGVNQHR